MKRQGFIAFFLLLMLAGQDAFSQCAMCRATLENNVSNGNVGIAAGINFGILYLFFTPYLAVGTIIFLWYRASKKNERKQMEQSALR